MKNKTLVILIFVLFLLSGLFLLRTYWPKLNPQPSFYSQKIEGIDKENVKKIEIKDQGGNIVLEKKDGIWMISGKIADKDKIQNIIDSVITEVKVDVISQTSSQYERFELTDNLATNLHIEDLDILVGKSGAQGAYVRFRDDDKVFLLIDLDTYMVSSDPSYFLDKTIISLDLSDINKVSFTLGGRSKNLVKKDGKWVEERSEKDVDNEKMDELTREFISFVAKDTFIDDEISKNYSGRSSLSLVLEYSGNTEDLQFFKGEGDYIVKRGSDGQIFSVNEEKAEQIVEKTQDLL